MKRLIFSFLAVFLLGFNYAYSDNCKLLTFRRTDYKCLSDCWSKGYSYGYCKSIFSNFSFNISKKCFNLSN